MGGGYIRVFWCCVVGGGVCCDHGMAHGVKKRCSTPGTNVVDVGEDLEGCCKDGVGMVAGCGEGWVGSVGVGMVEGAKGSGPS